MNQRRILTLTSAIALALAVTLAPAADPAATDTQRVARGEYLVKIMVCNDCHTPWVEGPRGPEPDMARALSGHPQELVMPPAPASLGDGWVWAGGASNTTFAGPWGVSFAANLTPDIETGLGRWTAATFIQTVRSGRHEGIGRPILPPMPWPMYRNATDEDLGAIFAYLQSLPPIRNRVPLPIDPPEIR